MRAIDADALQLAIVEEGQANKRKKYIIGDIWELTGAEIRKVIDSQPTIQPEPPWIPVMERLPKELETVLMTVYRTDKSFNQIPYLRIGYMCRKEWYPIPQSTAPFELNLSSYDGGNPVVLAWMPLPEPYKGVNT